MANLPIMLSLQEAAAKTGLSYGFLREAFLQDKIPGIRCGKKIYLNGDELASFLGGRRNENQ